MTYLERYIARKCKYFNLKKVCDLSENFKTRTYIFGKTFHSVKKAYENFGTKFSNKCVILNKKD